MNHLGNVLVTVSDKKKYNAGGWYEADVISASDYYPFGMQMPGRNLSASGYRYGFNGKENDNEAKGSGNQQDYGMRIYDPRVSRFLSIDPLTKKYPELTPYQYASNRPIDGIDLDGLEWYKAVGDWLYNNTLYGFATNACKTAKAVYNGDKKAILGLTSYSATKYIEGREVFGANGTRNQKEEFFTTLALDAAAAYALPKLANSKAANVISDENAAASSSKTSVNNNVNKQVAAVNGGNVKILFEGESNSLIKNTEFNGKISMDNSVLKVEITYIEKLDASAGKYSTYNNLISKVESLAKENGAKKIEIKGTPFDPAAADVPFKEAGYSTTTKKGAGAHDFDVLIT